METRRRTNSLNLAGVGIDIVELADIHAIRYKRRFAEYFLQASEIQHMPSENKQAAFLGSRFAVKEAVIKAFPKPLKPHDFSIVKKGNRPTILFAKKAFNTDYHVAISLTHTTQMAAAIAVAVRLGYK